MVKENRKRAVILKTRCTEEEAEAIKTKAYDSGMCVDEFLRASSLGRKTKNTVQGQIIDALRDVAILLKQGYLIAGHEGQKSDFSCVLQEVKTAMLKISGGLYDRKSSEKEEV